MPTLYMLTFPNGKCYVGQTRQKLEKRFRAHRNEARANRKRTLVGPAWRKHGEPMCCAIGEFSEEDINAAEIKAIKDLDSLTPGGYNILPGGLASKHTAATRKRIGDAHRGRKRSPEVRAILRAAFANKPPMSAESRAKSAASRRGQTRSEATRAKMRAAWRMDAKRHRPRSAETRARMATAQQQKAATLSNAQRRAMAERTRIAKTGIVPSLETRAKISASLKGRVFSDAERAKISAACLARWAAKRRDKIPSDL